MSNPKFTANVTFEVVEESRKWVQYKVYDQTRGHLGYFRINKENGYCDDRDDLGELQLGPWFAGEFTAEAFVDRFEMLNWVYDVFSGMFDASEYPPYHFVST